MCGFVLSLGRIVSATRFNKLSCICHYFDKVTSAPPNGVITFERRVLSSSPSWEGSSSLLTQLHADSKGTIECNGQGMLQVITFPMHDIWVYVYVLVHAHTEERCMVVNCKLVMQHWNSKQAKVD